jgi:hypothetical protein
MNSSVWRVKRLWSSMLGEKSDDTITHIFMLKAIQKVEDVITRL